METDSVALTSAEEDSDWTGSYTWRVEHWTQLRGKKIYSPEFEIGGYLWRLSVSSRSKSNERTADFISVHLEFKEAGYTSRRMCPKAKFDLVAITSTSPNDSLKRAATHTFTIEESDWGFTQVIRRQDALNLQNGYLVNDVLALRVNMKIENDHPSLKSKLETGSVGIKSQEETSLFAAFLQCLFHIKAVRNVVLQKSTMGLADPQNSAPLALQELFYKLQHQNTSAKIKNLMKALDWDSTNMCLQHDIQKTQHVLFEMLGKHDRASGAKDYVSELFMGEYSSYIESPYKQNASTSEHSFTGIPLNVLECTDIYTSLEKFCHSKRLEEGNSSHETSHVVGDSEQYALFDSLPTILQFNLKRCHYNPECKAFLKINSHYKFYDELDLDYKERVLLSKNADQTIENKYKLHSVLVHVDGPDGGRYFAFIRRDEKWYKFDGESVKEVSSQEAISEQFGDQRGTASANFSKGFKGNSKSAAVMLIYIDKSAWERVMCDYRATCLPMQIRVALENERKEKERRHIMKQEALHYVTIKLATELHFAEQIGKKHYFDLVDFEAVKNYRIHEKTPFGVFQIMVSRDFGVPKHLQRYWQWIRKTNDSIGVSEHPIKGVHDFKTVSDLRRFRDKTSSPSQQETVLMTIKLFLESPEQADVTREILHPIQENELLIFLKYYDPESSKLSYLGHMFVDKDCPFCMIFEKAKKMAGLNRRDEVIGFKEAKNLSTVVCSDLVPDSTPSMHQVIQGDIIIIQKVIANSQRDHPTVGIFFEFIQNCIKVTFRPLKNPKDGGFRLRFLKTMTHEQVINTLAKHLQIDHPKKLRLTQHEIDTGMPHMSPIRYNEIESLEQMMLHGKQYTNIFYYTVLDEQLASLETLICLTVGFHNSKGDMKSAHHLMLSKDDTVSGLVKALKAELSEEYNDCDMRIQLILFSKVFKVLDLASALKPLCESYSIYRAEVIPEEQKNLKSDEYLVLFCHCKPGNNGKTVFGYPLWVKIKRCEIVRDVRSRIQKTLEISDEEFSHWRFAYHGNPMLPLDYLKDEDEILAKFSRIALCRRTNGELVGDNTCFIAMVHEDTRLGD